MQKKYFGLLDTRNTKYQGIIKDGSFNGIGILIDNLFTTIVTQWKNYTLNQHTFIIFPFLQIFFGEVQDNQPKGICCFQLSEQQKIIFQKVPKLNNIKLAYIIQKKTITHYQKINENIKLIGSYGMKNQSEEISILSKIFNKQIAAKNLFFSQFIRTNIIQKYPQFDLMARNQIFFGFKNTTTLGFKMQNNFPIAIGNFTKFPRKLIFGRKIFKNSFPKIHVQQGRFEQPSKIFSFPINKIPLQAQKFNEQYFKQSTIFQNQFTKLDHIDQFYINLKKIQKGICNESILRFGQITLQNAIKNQEPLPIKEYTLSEVKQQIYKAAQKKNTIYKKDKSLVLSTQRNHIESTYIEPIQIKQEQKLSLQKKRPQINYDYSQQLQRTRSQRLISQKPKIKKYLPERYLDRRDSKELSQIRLLRDNSLNRMNYKNVQNQISQNYLPVRKYNRYDLSPKNILKETSQNKNNQKIQTKYQRYAQSDKKVILNKPQISPYDRLRSPTYNKQNSPFTKQFVLPQRKQVKKIKKQSQRFSYYKQDDKYQQKRSYMQEIKLFGKNNGNFINKFYQREYQRFNDNSPIVSSFNDHSYSNNRSKINVPQRQTKKPKRTFNYIQ